MESGEELVGGKREVRRRRRASTEEVKGEGKGREDEVGRGG